MRTCNAGDRQNLRARARGNDDVISRELLHKGFRFTPIIAVG